MIYSQMALCFFQGCIQNRNAANVIKYESRCRAGYATHSGLERDSPLYYKPSVIKER
jgi:hypothetical protein